MYVWPRRKGLQAQEGLSNFFKYVNVVCGFDCAFWHLASDFIRILSVTCPNCFPRGCRLERQYLLTQWRHSKSWALFLCMTNMRLFFTEITDASVWVWVPSESLGAAMTCGVRSHSFFYSSCNGRKPTTLTGTEVNQQWILLKQQRATGGSPF